MCTTPSQTPQGAHLPSLLLALQIQGFSAFQLPGLRNSRHQAQVGTRQGITATKGLQRDQELKAPLTLLRCTHQQRKAK